MVADISINDWKQRRPRVRIKSATIFISFNWNILLLRIYSLHVNKFIFSHFFFFMYNFVRRIMYRIDLIANKFLLNLCLLSHWFLKYFSFCICSIFFIVNLIAVIFQCYTVILLQFFSKCYYNDLFIRTINDIFSIFLFLIKLNLNFPICVVLCINHFICCALTELSLWFNRYNFNFMLLNMIFCLSYWLMLILMQFNLVFCSIY